MNKIKGLISAFCIFLIVMIPVCMAVDEFEQQGENLIIEAKQTEPETLRSDDLEQMNIPVRIILGAIRGAPISVPENIRVDPRIIKKAEAAKKNASVEGTSDQVMKDYVQGTPKWYKAPYPTLDNLGYIQITLKKIEKESDVPKQIDLDFEAKITYEAEKAAFTIGGEDIKEIRQATVNMVKEEREKHSILGGQYYLRAIQVKYDSADVEVLDQDFKSVTRTSLKLGEISRSLSLKRSNDEVQPESIRLKLEEVKGAGAVKLNIDVGGEIKTKSFEKGQEINGGWKIDNYFLTKTDTNGQNMYTEDDWVRIKYKTNIFKTPVILVNDGKHNTIKALKDIVTSCEADKDGACAIYKDSAIDNLKGLKLQKADFQQAVEDIELIGVKGLEGIEPKNEKPYATIDVGGKEMRFYSGDYLKNEGTCKCTVSVSRDSVSIIGIRTCDQYSDYNQKSYNIGETDSICRTAIEIKEITSVQEAVIRVLPGTGEGKTTTYFSVHLPVEKRALQYTPDELQDKINKTEALIAKLDKTIASLQTLVEGWTKICLATMAVITVMAFFEGTSKTPETAPATPTTGGTQPAEGKPMVGIDFGTHTKMYIKSDIHAQNTNAKKELQPTKDRKYVIENDKVIFEQTGTKSTEVGNVLFRFYDEKNQVYRLKKGIAAWTFEPAAANTGNMGPSDLNDVSVSSNKDQVIIPLKSCGSLPSVAAEKNAASPRMECERYWNNYGTALYLVYEEIGGSPARYMDVWWAGDDGKLDLVKKGKSDGDRVITRVDTSTPEGESLKKRVLEVKNAYLQGDKKIKFDSFEYNLQNTHPSAKKDGIECGKIMDPSKCKILFNACDPVMCPPSRCDLGGRYRTNDVIRSGLIGSLVLCLPNIKDGVVMPVCLSGILAALKNIRSILKGYVDCLRSSLNDQKSVGICDRIRSIYMCQILWKEAMTLMGIAGGNLFDAATARGGGEYFTGLKGGVDNAKKNIDYFTNEYATSVFAGYKGKSTQELGTVICEKAIYGKGPLLGDIVGDITKAQNPVQFTAYVEEQPLYTVTEQKSTYKIYFHIYAGSQNVNYKVFLRKEGKTQTCPECSGSLQPEGYADKVAKFAGPAKYEEICVVINDKQECNFGRVVSTSFGINAANNYLLQYELSKNIKTEAECRADLRGISSTAQVERVCNQNNPGMGKGTAAENMWQKVGTCGEHPTTKAPLGDCWMKLGNLENTNPQAYREVTAKTCENQGGQVCSAGQKCNNNIPIDDTEVKGYQKVLCCKTCVDDPVYKEVDSKLQEFKSESYYSTAYSEGAERCRDSSLGTNNPFENLPQEWYAFEKQMEDKKWSEDRNRYFYFRGLMYMYCTNCDDAQSAFIEISKTSSYYKAACGEDVPELGRGGIFFSTCQSRTCTGVTPKTTAPQTPSTTPTEPKLIPLRLTSLKITSPSGATVDKIDMTSKEITLDAGGIYKLEQMRFDRSVKSCSFKAGSGDFKAITPTTTTGDCEFKETNEISTIGLQELDIHFLGEPKDPLFDGDIYSGLFKIKITEQSAKDGKVLLCKNKAETQAFCLYQSKYPEKRCSDFLYNNANYIYHSDYGDTNSCNNACTTYGDCITKDSLYLTPEQVSQRRIVVK